MHEASGLSSALSTVWGVPTRAVEKLSSGEAGWRSDTRCRIQDAADLRRKFCREPCRSHPDTATKLTIKFPTKNDRYQIPGLSRRSSKFETNLKVEYLWAKLPFLVFNGPMGFYNTWRLVECIDPALQSGRCLLPSGIPEYGSRQFFRIGFVLA